jgi:hypothetical protein
MKSCIFNYWRWSQDVHAKRWCSCTRLQDVVPQKSEVSIFTSKKTSETYNLEERCRMCDMFVIGLLWWDMSTVTRRNSAYSYTCPITIHLRTNWTSEIEYFVCITVLKAICNKIGICHVRIPGYPNMRHCGRTILMAAHSYEFRTCAFSNIVWTNS